MSSAKNNAKAAKADILKSGKPWLLIAVIAVVAAGAAGGGAWLFASRSAAQQIEQEQAKARSKASRIPAPAQYFALEPPFVVNLAGAMAGPRYLQVEVQLMTRDPEALKNVEQHAPAIRAKLLMLFAQAQADALADRAGKEKLQAAALRDVKALMTAETGKPGVEQLLFTSFVMQ
ncbi:flagellar FliL protein [Luteimonas cucumeris]|uniref:Flagellar protein FliL n=1 Tax=Luteimonas cucumeris TaxID=985012 RepID=A0A562L5D1_9GAMM|nr:flagellar basal body-associated FliL family protein [Luteimonas cucumeris]TWI02795.1 flagellar FliL protein [Luteimonas cucumeris]